MPDPNEQSMNYGVLLESFSKTKRLKKFMVYFDFLFHLLSMSPATFYCCLKRTLRENVSRF